MISTLGEASLNIYRPPLTKGLQSVELLTMNLNDSKPGLSMSSKDLDEKRRRRLERNRESARECRRRKKEKLASLKHRIAHLEADNLQLRLKLQVGPEGSVRFPNSKSSENANLLASMISAGSSEIEIRKTIEELQEKYADYGRDRRSAVGFHVTQLHRCLQPTQTTKSMLWLLSYSPKFYSEEGFVEPDESDELAQLFADLHETLNPTQVQCRQLVELARAPMQPEVPKSSPLYSTIASSFMVPSSSSRATSTLTDSDNNPIVTSETMLKKLDELISDKNESLDIEMSAIQSILSGSQIAKFLVWMDRNPALMQMLEALWPHVAQSAGESEPSNTY